MINSIKKNYFYNLLYQVLLVISPLITMPFLSRSSGVSGIGEYSYAYSIISYFVLVATFGFDVYGRREISYYKDDIKKRTESFLSVQIIKTIFTIFTLICYIIFSLFNPNKILLFLLVFHLINVPLNIGWFFQGIEEFKKITIRGFLLKIIDLVFVVFFIKEPTDLNLYVFGSSFIAFVTFFALWIDIKKYICKVDLSFIKIKNTFKEGAIFFLPAIATSIYTLLDKTMLGIITKGYIENGYYEQAQKINVVLLKLVLALGTVLLPQIANAYKKNNKKNIQKFILKSANYVFFISIAIAFGLMSISEYFVPWFFGKSFNKVSILLNFSGFILIFQGLDDIFGMQYLVSTNNQKKYVISLFLGAFVNFFCNLILIRHFQSVGALIASLIGEIAIVFIQIFMVKKDINVFEILKLSYNYFFAGIIMYLICKIVSIVLNPSIFATIILTLVGIVTYTSVLLILKDKFFINIIDSYKSKIKLKKYSINKDGVE